MTAWTWWQVNVLAVVLLTILKRVFVIICRSLEYSNNFSDMVPSLCLCFFTLIVSTYTIPAESKYISTLIILIMKFFYTSQLIPVFSITQHSIQTPIFMNIKYFSIYIMGYFTRWGAWKILLRNFRTILLFEWLLAPKVWGALVEWFHLNDKWERHKTVISASEGECDLSS